MEEYRNDKNITRRKSVKKDNKNQKDKVSHVKNIFLYQIIICILIFIVFLVINIFNKNFTQYILENYKSEIEFNYSISDFYMDIQKFVDKFNPKPAFSGMGGGDEDLEFEKDILYDEEENNPDNLNSDLFEIEQMMTPLIYPVKNGVESSKFGYRKSPFSDKMEFHKALDIAAEKGSNIHATAKGRVIKASSTIYRGNYVEIDHGNNFITRYSHCDELLVKEGDLVDADQVIAKVGTTGQSTGNHLHFEMIKDGESIDPSIVLGK